jgi:hypothetical protein
MENASQARFTVGKKSPNIDAIDGQVTVKLTLPEGRDKIEGKVVI